MAQDVNCTSPQTQFELNECSSREWQSADKDLNDAWRIARRAMKRRDAELPDYLRGAAEAMLKGQRGWIVYRDGQCATERSDVAGGTMAPMVGFLCLTRLTRARTKELLQTANPNN